MVVSGWCDRFTCLPRATSAIRVSEWQMNAEPFMEKASLYLVAILILHYCPNHNNNVIVSSTPLTLVSS
jgi:hypothetical protein